MEHVREVWKVDNEWSGGRRVGGIAAEERRTRVQTKIYKGVLVWYCWKRGAVAYVVQATLISSYK